MSLTEHATARAAKSRDPEAEKLQDAAGELLANVLFEELGPELDGKLDIVCTSHEVTVRCVTERLSGHVQRATWDTITFALVPVSGKKANVKVVMVIRDAEKLGPNDDLPFSIEYRRTGWLPKRISIIELARMLDKVI